MAASRPGGASSSPKLGSGKHAAGTRHLGCRRVISAHTSGVLRLSSAMVLRLSTHISLSRLVGTLLVCEQLRARLPARVSTASQSPDREFPFRIPLRQARVGEHYSCSLIAATRCMSSV